MQPLPLRLLSKKLKESGCTARAWHYVRPDQSFVPHGASGSFDCCGVFIAKQNPSLTPAYAAGSDKLPLFYTGCNGAFFGPRACALGSVEIGRHAFAGLAGPANVSASWVLVTNGTLRVTATGGVRVSAVGVAGVSAELCDPVDGTEVLVAWRVKRGKTPCPDSGAPPHGCTPTAAQSLRKQAGGAIGLVFDVPEGGVLYAWHI